MVFLCQNFQSYFFISMKTVLINDLSKGIGKAPAKQFLSSGFTVFGTSRSGQLPN